MAQAQLNGVDIARNHACRKMEPKLVARASVLAHNACKSAFGENPHFESISDYHEAAASFLNECRAAGVPPGVALSFAAIQIDELERRVWKPCSGGQEPTLYVASNTSEVSPNVIFGNGCVDVHDGKRSGYFGIWINSRKDTHLKYINDYMPFSFMLEHGRLPAGINFFGACLPELVGITDINETAIHSIYDERLTNAARLALMRMNNYTRMARAGGHWIEDGFYFHPSSATVAADKIPIFSSIYDGRDRTVRLVEPDGSAKKLLRTYFDELKRHRIFKHTGADARLEQLAHNLKEHEQNETYPLLSLFSRETKELGCVDARMAHIWDLRSMIKEIGAAITIEEMRRIASSSFASSLIIGTHTYCGYLTQLIHVHMISNELREIFGSTNHRLRRILGSSLEQIKEGNTTFTIDSRIVANSIDGNQSIAKKIHTAKGVAGFLTALLSGTTSDVRETLHHALSRNVLEIGEDGLLSMPAAAKIEEITREIIPDLALSPEHFAFLVTEEYTRDRVERFNVVLSDPEITRKRAEEHGDPSFDVAPMITDLHTGARVSPRRDLPQNREELLRDKARPLFYQPSMSETIIR